MRKVFIYILVDPRRPEGVRYVGQTLTPRSRLIQHCCESGQSGKCQWIEALARDGIMPQMIVVEETTESESDAKERLWIARFKLSDLVNASANPKPQKAPPANPPIPLPVRQTTLKTISEVERDVIAQMLKDTGGNKLEASKRLGIGRQTLYNKIKLYQLQE